MNVAHEIFAQSENTQNRFSITNYSESSGMHKHDTHDPNIRFFLIDPSQISLEL